MATNRVGDKVKTLRERRGLSQVALAAKAGLTQPHVSMIEAGARMPSLAVLARLAKILKVQPGELLT